MKELDESYLAWASIRLQRLPDGMAIDHRKALSNLEKMEPKEARKLMDSILFRCQTVALYAAGKSYGIGEGCELSADKLKLEALIGKLLT